MTIFAFCSRACHQNLSNIMLRYNITVVDNWLWRSHRSIISYLWWKREAKSSLDNFGCRWCTDWRMSIMQLLMCHLTIFQWIQLKTFLNMKGSNANSAFWRGFLVLFVMPLQPDQPAYKLCKKFRILYTWLGSAFFPCKCRRAKAIKISAPEYGDSIMPWE